MELFSFFADNAARVFIIAPAELRMPQVAVDDGKAEAEADCFDDRVVGSAIALQLHKVAGIDRIFS